MSCNGVLVRVDILSAAPSRSWCRRGDEQKARLYRDMTSPVANSAAATGAREAPDERRERYSSRRHRGRDYPVQRESRERDSRVSNAAASGWSGTCEELAA